jgi:hypothetical protein
MTDDNMRIADKQAMIDWVAGGRNAEIRLENWH